MQVVERLYGETLVQSTLLSLHNWQTKAQLYSTQLSSLPCPTILDHEVIAQLMLESLMWESITEANKAQRRLERVVEFYLRSY